ncbi:discoidin domain-containing protein [Paenibacillus sp. CMAA1739]|uniref:discoidin domain-containing protein n=1 Tax=Paenibacillus ottowii TaxID=2315729 RepID=UPI0027308192|nr:MULTISPECIES: discoidin domain-containing protein [Paenibacillus]MDP1512449.1 discoidin domain-containing protein [Paenibacillus ottowii]MEC4568417.1 discoidin domain-containing protein [Paenibacillus sp. CMAA1739]
MKKLLPILLSLFFLPWFAQITHAATPEATSLIPKMTSNTSPSGEVTNSAAYSGLEGYKAFDGKPNYSMAGNYTSWGTSLKNGWLAYEFPTPKIVTKYVLYYGGYSTNRPPDAGKDMPNTWTFEGSNDGKNWTVLDNKTEYVFTEGANEFSLNNKDQFKTYKINIAKNNGATGKEVNLSIHEMEMWGYDPATQTPDPVVPTPNPDPTPSPNPDPSDPAEPTQPTGDRAILTVTVDNGFDKEFDLSKKELNAFIAWYDAKDAGRGPSFFAIDKHNNNKGPFSNRKDYVIFNKILTFEVSEYSTK